MLLTLEYQPNVQELDIVCDEESIDFLMDTLKKLKKEKGKSCHTHLMTPSWAGNELTEERQTENGTLINHLRIVMKRRTPH